MSKEDVVTQTTENTKNTLKKSIYDIISIAIILAIILISLDIFGLRDLSWSYLGDFFIEWVPFFLASILLDSNLYEKGKYIGKCTQGYKDALDEFSKKASLLTGKKLKYFSVFCEEKNATVLKIKQEQILKSVGISYEEFSTELIKLSDNDLAAKYDKDICKVIKKAKNVKIVGLKVNLLLGNYDTADETDIGPTEEKTSRNYKTVTAIKSAASTILMTFLAIKNITSWGWLGLLLVIFKAAYIFAKSYMSYFRGYGDVTIKLTNQLIRKTDIFKEYDYWFEINVETVGNNLEKE